MQSSKRRPDHPTMGDGGDALARYADELRALLDAGELEGRVALDLLAGLDLAVAARIALGDLDDLRHLAATRHVPAARWDGILDDLAALVGIAGASAPTPHRPA